MTSRFTPIAWPPTTFIDGHEIIFEPRSTVWQLHQLGTGSWYPLIVGGLAPDSLTWVWNRLADLDDPFTLRVFSQFGIDVVEDLTVMPYKSAYKLAAAVLTGWLEFEGWCIEHAFNPSTEPVHRVLAAVYRAVISSHASEEEVRRVKNQIFSPADVMKSHLRNKAGRAAMEASNAEFAAEIGSPF